MLRNIRNYDFTLMITPILLAAFGVVMVYSASMVSAVVEGLESTTYLYKQIQWFVLGFLGFIFCSIFPYKKYQKFIKLIIFGSIALLIAVLLFGKSANHAVRSIVFFDAINIQPAEFVKLSIILYLASVYSKKQAYINHFSTAVVPPLVITGIILGLIVLQPDIGTASIILAIAAIIIFSSGVRIRHLFLLAMISVTAIAVAIPYLVSDTRIARITGAYQPFADPSNTGLHLIQSYIAIGAGGLKGEGLGQSIQKLGYLWGAHTDFIMSVIAEELGLIGIIIVLGMLGIIVLRGLFIAQKCKDSFGALLAIGISSMIGIQSFINLGSISGILPITGVPLPFLSYGGSSLMVVLISVGILNNIAMTVKKEQEQIRTTEQQVNISEDDYRSERQSLQGKPNVVKH